MTISGISQLAGQIGNAAQTVAGVIGPQGGSQFPAAGSYFSQLQPASFRGIPFGTFGSEIRFGRRNAVHEYPYRDTVWIEDLGRAARRIRLTGFLLGDDIIAKRERLIAACEQPGDGQLVHPSLGTLTVNVVDVVSAERREQGRVFEITFTFIEGGQRVFPSVTTSTGEAVTSAALGANTAASADFVTAATAAIRSGVNQVALITSSVQTWARVAQRAVNSATNLYNIVGSLQGSFGRFFGGRRSGATSALTSIASSVSALIAAGSVVRGVVASANARLTSDAGQISAASAAQFATDAQAIAAAVLAGGQDPATAISGLTMLAQPNQNNIQPIQVAADDLFRRAAVVAMAQASSSYQPASYDDAAAVRASVCTALDAEITIAADEGQDGSYLALRTLRAAVSTDLTARGASLAPLITVSTIQTLPALALAQRLYKDSTRVDELITEGNPRHPAFMPRTFKALAN